MNSRKPQAITDLSSVVEEQENPFTTEDTTELEKLGLVEPERIGSAFGWGKLCISALSVLIILSLGLWADGLVRSLFERYSFLGWTALAATLIGFLALLIFILNEIRALMRLRSVDHLRDEAAIAVKNDDMVMARKSVDDLIRYTSHTAFTFGGRSAMQSHRHDIIDGRGLIHLAEYEILRPLDLEARKIILGSAKRVSIVTAVSPRALVDLGYVLYESTRLIRKLATLYGARPGRFGFIALARRVLAHLAVTGSLAISDGLVQQVIGQGLATRLSARLGEGVVNGLMTTRIGIAAMDALRPFPFDGQRRPGLSDFTSDLIGLNAQKPKTREKKQNSTSDSE